MAQSEAFARIKSQILAMTGSIPFGKVATYKSIGDHIEVMSRHVAYILTMLDEDEKETVPWYRVVGEKGEVKAKNADRYGHTQRDLLIAEGIPIEASGKVKDLARYKFEISETTTGIPYQPRPAGAKATRSKKRS